MRENLLPPERYHTTPYEKFLDFLIEKTESYKAPEWKEFIAVYPRKKIEEDINRWGKKRKGPERWEPSDEEMLRADMATRLVLYAVGNLGALEPKNKGWEVYSERSHSLDDEFNGTDMVIVFRNEETGEETPLAVDVTTTSDEGVLEEKYNRIRRSLEKGRLTELEYYKSPIKGAIGEAEMPLVVLQYEQKQLKELASTWLEKGGDWQALRNLKGEVGKELKKDIAEQLKTYLQTISKSFPGPQMQKVRGKIEKVLELLI